LSAMPTTAACIKVPKQKGETAITLASKMGLYNNTLSIEHEGNDLCIPLKRDLQAYEVELIKTHYPYVQLGKRTFSEKTSTSINLTQALTGKLPEELLADVPGAFDIIGDIVVIEIPTPLKPYEKVIGDAILQTHKNIKVVLGKASDIGGVFRVRDYTFLAGEDRTNTVHREFGCKYHVDLAKAYFSPRLSHEHERVAAQVQADETVADLFAGVGPFAILIGKRQTEATVYAVDLNPDAVELLKVNVRANRVDSQVFPVCADAREIAAGKLHGVADRVIMNLPETAIDFVDAACNAIKPQGGAVHFYAFIRQPDTIENLKQRFSDFVKLNHRKVKRFIYAKSIRETAPFESQIALDAKIV
jgi:tRNA (guanine37-N1)-methyltransferase